ncbi:MAG: PilT/PilU family type 4a pilus ATPase [Pseudomonadota bacterium]
MNTKVLLSLMAERKASDLFLTVGSPVKIKIEGRILSVNKQVLTPANVRQAAIALMSSEQMDRFSREMELDFALSEPEMGRFRINVFHQRGNVAMCLRYITGGVPSLTELGMPEVLTDLAMLKRGLILMVGATGSGKSTSLAAMIDHRNRHATDHILTIEDPIEYLHSNVSCIVNQREVGIDTVSYARALRSALREAPDVVLIGEIRDRDSLRSTIDLAGTGHLALSTMHANNAAETLDRIVNMFPMEQHAQVLMDLSQYLKAIVSQRLVIGRTGKRVAAVEVLLVTPYISDLIKKGDISSVKEALAEGREPGTQNFDEALYRLYASNRISLEEALVNADSRNNLESRINFG